MFGTLLESRARREREGKGAALSVVIHAGLIVLAVAATATARSGPQPRGPEEDTIAIYNPPPKAPPPPIDGVLPSGRVPREVVIGEIDLVPRTIPDFIPAVDSAASTPGPTDWEPGPRDIAGVQPGGTPDAGTAANPLFDFQVDKPVVASGGCSPRYPGLLRSAGVGGMVVAQFVVDERGRVVEGTFKALRSTHDLFTEAVRACLPSMKFWPAEAGARKVSQLVQQPFVFALEER